MFFPFIFILFVFPFIFGVQDAVSCSLFSFYINSFSIIIFHREFSAIFFYFFMLLLLFAFLVIWEEGKYHFPSRFLSLY